MLNHFMVNGKCVIFVSKLPKDVCGFFWNIQWKVYLMHERVSLSVSMIGLIVLTRL